MKDSLTSEITELKKKLEENPDSLVFAPLAEAFRKEGNLEEALKVCKKGLEKHPSNTSARVVLGRIYQGQGKTQEAANELKKVLELDSDNLMAHSLLGSIYMEKGDHQAAIEEYQKILTLNPDDEEIQTTLKQAIEKAAGDTKGTSSSKKGLPVSEKKASMKDSTATLTMAELYLKQGHLDKAIEVFRELLANDPQNLMMRQKLAEVLERQKKESGSDAASKLKKSEFIKPPDQKEDVLEESSIDRKDQVKPKKEDDSKFTNDDILQVMRRGGKDDLVVEEKKAESAPLSSHSAPAPKLVAVAKKPEHNLQPTQIDNLKSILADLSSVEGIMRCFVAGNEGITIVSMGETSNNADLGKQALAIFESTNRSVAQLNQGKMQQVLVTAESGHILLVSFAAYILVVLASSKINLGLLRLALESATKKLDKIL